MTQSLVCGESSDDGAPMMRSASFHYENARTRALTSEDESAEDYGSGSESHQVWDEGLRCILRSLKGFCCNF